MKNGSHTRTITPPHWKLSKRTSGESVDQSLCKSHCDRCFFLSNNPIPWISKKHSCVFLYNATDSNYSRMIWMKQTLIKYNVIQDVMTLYCDNFTEVLEASQIKTLRDKLGICQYEKL